MSGIKLIIPNADFSNVALLINSAEGPANSVAKLNKNAEAYNDSNLENFRVVGGTEENVTFNAGGFAEFDLDDVINSFKVLFAPNNGDDITGGWTSPWKKISIVSDSPSITNLVGMFTYCNSLTDVRLKINAENVTDCHNMFTRCSALEKIDLSRITWSSALTSCGTMFEKCFALTEINLNGFVVTNIADYNQMFNNCKNLTKVYVSDSTTAGFIITALGSSAGTSNYNWSYNSEGGYVERGSLI